MCIIIINENNLLPYESFIGNNEINPDGIGIFYAENSNLIVKKFPPNPNLEEVYNYYSEIRAKTKNTIVLHFRKRSKGEISIDGVHPYYINKNLVMAHNGTFANLGNDKISDTVEFADILKSLPNNFLDNDYLLKLIKMASGKNRLVFMDNKGKVTKIDEEKMGEEYKGDWYSKEEYFRY
ncbi:MAG TPA: class II glutamine amidotransferase [Melioribacteraceae bacterium]|nr:class II glutamine amidotransferase [Melioribacteraceae bacterium]